MAADTLSEFSHRMLVTEEEETVGFFPATPDAVLAKEFQEILTEELGRLKMNGRIIEESGVSLKRLLVKVDLTGCIFKEDGCLLCGSGLPGGSHTLRGAK